MNDTVITEVKDALKGMETKFNTAMSAFEAYKTEVAPKLGKLDTLDEAKFNKITDTIATAIDESQKITAKLKAVEESVETKQKSLETEISELKTAFNRQPTAGTTEDKSKADAALRRKAFNEFSRMRSENREGFAEYLEKRGHEDAEIKSLSVNSDPNGGYLTMPDMGGIIQTRVFETSPIRQLATVTPIGSDTYEVILDNDEASSGWVGETQARSTTNNPTLGKLTIYCNELYANPKATQKILDDAGIDMEAWLAQKVADKFGRDEASAFVAGNGVNKPKGFLSYAAGTDINAQQIQQVVTGSATTFTYDGMVDLQNSLKEPYQVNATFLLQRASLAVILKVKQGEGVPIFNMAFDKNTALESMLMGRPYRFAADMPAASTNNLALAYGDFRSGYQIVDRAGIRVLRDPYTDKPNVAFYTTKRTGGGVVNFEALKLQKIAIS
jgi:HK97 family phage major capsid protein